MPANAAIYIQQGSGDLTTVFDGVKSDKGLLRRAATRYDVPLGGETVRFNVMDPKAVAAHVQGFLGYIASLDQDEARKRDTAHAIGHTTVVLGLVTEREFEDNPAIWPALFRIADAFDGFVFAFGSVLLPNGAVLVGPLLDQEEENDAPGG